MEYERTSDGQIYADFARRAGQLLLQYERLSRGLPRAERFEATLALSLLYPLLTSCVELLNHNKSRSHVSQLHDLAKRSLLEEPTHLGLEVECVRIDQWPADTPITYRDLFRFLRNAVSHPCPQGTTRYPMTGYSAVSDDSGQIEAFEFVQSPWVSRSGQNLSETYAPPKGNEESRLTLEKTVQYWMNKNHISGLSIALDEFGKWCVFRGGKPFVPVIRIRMTVEQLRTFTLTLCDYLCDRVRQPVAEHA